MTSGILVDKKSRKKVLLFRNIDRSVEKITENHGLNLDGLEFIPESDLDIDLEEARSFHKIDSDGSIEDIRRLQGYRIFLEDRVSIDEDITAIGNSRTLEIDKIPTEGLLDRIEEKMGMEISGIDEIKRED